MFDTIKNDKTNFQDSFGLHKTASVFISETELCQAIRAIFYARDRDFFVSDKLLTLFLSLDLLPLQGLQGSDLCLRL
jgi:hypothetical protein